jgi:hypothetical protein
MENIKVFKMGDYEWWATKFNKEETLEWYIEESGLLEDEVSMDEMKECDLDKEGMWWETNDPEDIKKLGDADEIVGIEKINGRTRKRVRFGNLMRRGAEVYKFIPFREALEKYGDFEESSCFCLATTEW